MNVAISGASGFVGTALSRSLESAGHRVFKLSRHATEDNLADGVIAWDPLNGLKNPNALNGFDALFHLAGKSIGDGRWSDAVKAEIRDSRVAATQKLAEQLVNVERPPKVVLSASATGIYGTRISSSAPSFTEEQELDSADFLARVAQDWEAACDPLRCVGVRVVHPRLGIVLGKQGGALQKMLPIFRWCVAGRLGSGDQYWSWIALDDCVRALVWLLQQEAAVGPYNLVAPNPVTNREFTRILASEIGRPAFLPAPAFLLKTVLGEMAEALLLGDCPVVPERLLRQGFSFESPDLQKFLAAELA